MLWYVLLKEHNMLLTMQEAYKRESRTFPSEERVDKVEESMANLESVVKERNRAYWQLEVSQEQTGLRPWAFRKDTFGRYYWLVLRLMKTICNLNRPFQCNSFCLLQAIVQRAPGALPLEQTFQNIARSGLWTQCDRVCSSLSGETNVKKALPTYETIVRSSSIVAKIPG